MSRNSKILFWGMVCFAAAAVIVTVRPVQGAKPAPPLSLTASFDEFWVGGENLYRIQNDAANLPYVNTPEQKVGKKVIPSGVEVKYYPPGGSDTIGRFKMIIDQSGSLHRFVQLHFLNPSTNPACDESALPPDPVDPLFGGTGTLLTNRIAITTGLVQKVTDDGYLWSDPDQPPLAMDKMLTGQSKIVLMGIEFKPAGIFSARTYYLGILASPDWTGNVICPDKGYVLSGTAELYCVESGRAWEFRPHAASFINAPDNVTRLLHTNVQLSFLASIKLRAWTMPFVLKVWK